jgi:hypothetical protein
VGRGPGTVKGEGPVERIRGGISGTVEGKPWR